MHNFQVLIKGISLIGLAICTVTLIGCATAPKPSLTPIQLPTSTPEPIPTIAAEPTSIPEALFFETIEMTDWPGTGDEYPGDDLYISIITSKNDVVHISDWVSKWARFELLKFDYANYFALAIFLGYRPNSCFSIKILSTTRQNNIVTVETFLESPQPEQGCSETIAHPYHLVKIPKLGDWDTDITFNVVVDGKIVALETHFIPSRETGEGQPSDAGTDIFTPNYDKLDPKLNDLLQNTSDDSDELIPVTIWMKSSKEMKAFIRQLEAGGYIVTTSPGPPIFAVDLPKNAILELSIRDDIDRIYLVDGEAVLE